jgi:alpha-mannosidase
MKSCGAFDSTGNSLPAEMLPLDISYSGIQFELAPSGKCAPNAVVARGQEIALPARPIKRIYILAAADGEQNGTFRVGDNTVELGIDDWGGFIGQWDTRIWQQRSEAVPARPGAPVQPPGMTPRMRTSMVYSGLSPAFIKRTPVAWFASHHHTAEGVNVPYGYSYLFAYSIDVPANAKTVTLPNNDKIRILAITASDEDQRFSSAEPLYDVFERGDR